MRFALSNGKKTEATKGAKGICPICDLELIAKCGEVKVNHWAHKGKSNCDSRWENEGPWHRSWKEQFPIDWQEKHHRDGSGEKHTADVKTESGWVLEFQHSYIKPEEGCSRNEFYKKLVWVVDGLRREKDIKQFLKIINESTLIRKELIIRKVSFPEKCKLLKEWHDSKALVFFDFQEAKGTKLSDLWFLFPSVLTYFQGAKDTKQSVLWFLFPRISTDEVYISPFSRDKFIEMHNNIEFDEFESNYILPINKELVAMNWERVAMNWEQVTLNR